MTFRAITETQKKLQRIRNQSFPGCPQRFYNSLFQAGSLACFEEEQQSQLELTGIDISSLIQNHFLGAVIKLNNQKPFDNFEAKLDAGIELLDLNPSRDVWPLVLGPYAKHGFYVSCSLFFLLLFFF